jgi:hypothetical protein
MCVREHFWGGQHLRYGQPAYQQQMYTAAAAAPAEAYDVLHVLGGLSNDEIAAVFAEWNQGELQVGLGNSVT